MAATSALPALPRPAVAPVTVQPPLPVASNGVVPLVGITSAPVTLSTQILRVSAPSLSLSSSNTLSAWESRGATNYLEAQIALAGLGFSSGSIDGVGGAQTAAALKAFQLQQGLEQTGWLDRNTRKVLILRRPPVVSYRVSADDLLRLAPVPETWVGKSQVVGLEHETLLERLAERFQAHPGLLRRLNSAVDWAQPTEGLELTLPAIPPISARRAGLIRINLAGRFLRVFDTSGELMAHFPCSIARRVEKRPVGDLQVSVTVPKLRIPPGPNNPVGVAWIGLNRSGYGIHGTPKPEDVGRTESHGCFRLANWNAELLRRMAWPGLTVRVEGEAPGTPSTVLTASATTVTNAVKASLPSGVSTNPAPSSSPAITNSVSPSSL
jgi:lipoprotein-anchoring transpeptidase ErfK/SrfK